MYLRYTTDSQERQGSQVLATGAFRSPGQQGSAGDGCSAGRTGRRRPGRGSGACRNPLVALIVSGDCLKKNRMRRWFRSM
jgi:hypothetical protein